MTTNNEHLAALRDFASAYDAESENGRALRAAIEALTAPPKLTGRALERQLEDSMRSMMAGDYDTAPPLCAKGATRLGRHMTGRMIEGNFEADTITFQMDRGYYMAAGAYVIEPRDDWEARTTPAQPRREVTEADVDTARSAFLAINNGGLSECLRAALESFANGG